MYTNIPGPQDSAPETARDQFVDTAIDEAFAAEAWGHDFWSADPLVEVDALKAAADKHP